MYNFCHFGLYVLQVAMVLHLNKVNLSCRVSVLHCYKLLWWEAFLPVGKHHTSRLPSMEGIMAESREKRTTEHWQSWADMVAVRFLGISSI